MLSTMIIFILSLISPAQPIECTMPGEVLIEQYLSMDKEGRLVPLLVPERFAEDRSDRVQGAIHGAQLFRLDTSTFEPVSRKDTGVRLKQGRRDFMNILLRDFIDISAILRTRLKGFRATDSDAYTKDFMSEQHKSGFELVVGDLAPVGSDLFYLGSKSSPEIVAACKTRADLKFPSCVFFFETAGLEVKMTIGEQDFSRWREVKAGVDRFLACITTI